MIGSYGRLLAVVVLGALCMFSLPGSVMAGLSEDEDAILVPVQEQVMALQFGFIDRANVLVDDAAEEFFAKTPNSISKNLKIYSAAIAKIEKDAVKTAKAMVKAVNKGVVRAEQINGSKELFGELEELRLMAQELETLAPLEFTEQLYSSFGLEYEFVP